jgi:SAM-dependent methyltransferase
MTSSGLHHGLKCAKMCDSAMPSQPQKPDFTTITECPGSKATADQLSVLWTRYELAFKQARGKDVLEVACGGGMGLGLLAGVANSVVGGDIEEGNCRVAQETYEGRPRIEVKQLDAHCIPFPDRSFDLLLLFEALYYLPEPDVFFREARRVLRPGGTLLISTVNCQWTGFNPSPFARKYFTAATLAGALAVRRFQVSVLAGFPDRTNGPVRQLIGRVRRLAVKLHLIPKTMRGKEWLKRLFYGKLVLIPRELTSGMAVPGPLLPLNNLSDARHYRFIYAIATLPQVL